MKVKDIEFRGKLSHNGEWVYGNLIIANNGKTYIYPKEVLEPDGHHLICLAYGAFMVRKETVGLHMGIVDVEGNKIYAGDIIQSTNNGKTITHKVLWNAERGALTCYSTKTYFGDGECGLLLQDWVIKFNKRVIGNIYDGKDYSDIY
ncbi:hypothetical protein FACS1894195_0410 [Bacteroidia bacterium]|nr:hypothetical protein FACS1894195_0410 [Bacteroidia bacterium]